MVSLYSTIKVMHGPINIKKKKLMLFKGGDPVRSKIVIAKKVIVEVNSFNCLRILIYFEK